MGIVCRAIEERYSCRLFDQTKFVSKEIIDRILIAATLAPSGKNMQPWRFRVFNDNAFCTALSKILPNSIWLRQVSQIIIVFLDKKSSYDMVKDCMSLGAAIENMLIEARANDVDTCWIGECTNFSDAINKIIKVEDCYILMAIIAIGYSIRRLASPKKKTVDEVSI